MHLFILRHGAAGRRSATFRDDSKRPLTAEGEKEVKEVLKGLRALGIEPDYILTSPVLRAKQTAELVSKTLASRIKVSELDELKPEGNRTRLYGKLSGLKQSSAVLIVGHEPYLTELIGDAISNGGCTIDLKKAGLARIRLVTVLPKPRGELKWLLTSKQLKRIGR